MLTCNDESLYMTTDGLEVRLGRADYFLRFGQESGPSDRRTGCLAEIGGAQYVWVEYADL